jgi:hypothetical protein
MAISWVACDDAVVMVSPGTSPAQYPEMTTIAPERREIEVKPGFAGFVELAKAVGLNLEPFQRQIVKEALGPERELLVLIVRGNGKTSLQAAVALHHLLTVEDSEIYCCASSRDQAKILFQYADCRAESEKMQHLDADRIRRFRAAPGRRPLLKAGSARGRPRRFRDTVNFHLSHGRMM